MDSGFVGCFGGLAHRVCGRFFGGKPYFVFVISAVFDRFQFVLDGRNVVSNLFDQEILSYVVFEQHSMVRNSKKEAYKASESLKHKTLQSAPLLLSVSISMHVLLQVNKGVPEFDSDA